MIRRPPRPPLFPAPPLFRSRPPTLLRRRAAPPRAPSVLSCSSAWSTAPPRGLVLRSVVQHGGTTEPAIRHIGQGPQRVRQDRKSTRLNSSHANISYAVFCLK